MRRYNLALMLAITAGVVAPSPADAGTVQVTPSSMGTWAFYSTDSSGSLNTGSNTGQMVNGPFTPPLGTGSANLQTSSGGGDGSEQLRNSDWAGTPLSSLTSLSYSTYATSIGGDQLPFVNLYISQSGGTTRDDRLWFEPTYSSSTAGNGNPYTFQGPIALNTWQSWDMLQGMWYSDSTLPNGMSGPNGPGSNAITLQAYIAAFPNAKIVEDTSLGAGGIRIASGFSSPSDSYNTYVDAFTIGTAGGTTTYDFNLTPVPEPGSLALAGIGLLGLSAYAATARRRKRAGTK